MGIKRPADVAFHLGAAALSAYNSRYRSGSSTMTMTRPSTLPVLTEAGEYTRKNRRSGRYKRRTLKHLYNLVGATQQSFWYRFSGINRFNSADGGNYKLYNHLNTTGTGTEILPMYILDLTSVPNKNGSATTFNPAPCWIPIRSNTAPVSYQFSVVNCRNSAGVTQPGWSNENLASAEGGIKAPHRMGILKYSDIRFMCYGTTLVPIKYDISIVSFPDDAYNPFLGQVANDGTNPVFPAGGNVNSDVLIDDLMAPYSSNPLNIQDPKMKAKIRYHFRENFVIQPGQTTDAGVSIPHFREVKIFKKWDRMCRFDWSDNINTDPQANTLFMANNGNNWPTVNYQARRYLMVRATSGFTTSIAFPTFSISVNPSFDMLVRNKWSISV